MLSREWVKKHRLIKEFLDQCSSSSVRVSDVAKKLGMDQRTARAHLEVMEIDGFGAFTEENKTTFCRREAIKQLAIKFSELAKSLGPE